MLCSNFAKCASAGAHTSHHTTMRTLENHSVPESSTAELKVVAADPPAAGGMHHRYEVRGYDAMANPSRLVHDGPSNQLTIVFQNGPVSERGLNGVTNEVLLAIVADRLQMAQAGPYACSSNGRAQLLIEAALGELRSRTKERIVRAVEDTYVV